MKAGCSKRPASCSHADWQVSVAADGEAVFRPTEPRWTYRRLTTLSLTLRARLPS